MPLIVQKYLAWAQRFFYHIAAGNLPQDVNPTAQLTLDISQDWPLEPIFRPIAAPVTIAGTIQQDIYRPASGFHGLVYAGSLLNVGAGATAATTTYIVTLEQPGIGGVRMWSLRGTVLGVGQEAPVVHGNMSTIAAVAGNILGVNPIYVRDGQLLRLDITSVAGGESLNHFWWILERPNYYPLRLP